MSFLGLLFGRIISCEHFSHSICTRMVLTLCSGESTAMVIFRGSVGALLLVAIPIFSLFVLVIEPIHETGLTPFKGMKSHGLPVDFKPTNQPVWNVVIVSYGTF